MKKRIGIALLATLLLQLNETRSQALWPTVTKEMKPWTRWWWMGSAVDKPNLSRELDAMQKVGFGGVEITPIYGAKDYEKRYVPFLSDNWMAMLQHTVSHSNGLGMGVDINLGTGWPFGGPQIQPKDAATRVFLDEHTLKKGEKLHFPLKVSDSKQQLYHLQSLRAFDSTGEETNLDNYIQNKQGTWESPNNVTIIALFSGRTRQLVKRAAPGGEGYTLDHLGSKPVQVYFDRFRQVFGNNKIGVRAFFNDSYEVYGANWTDEFLTSFEQLKGYRLQDHLWHLSGKSDNKDKQARVKSDYREVVDHLLTHNFLVPFTQFANQHGAISKNQAHGSPGNLIDLYASTDIAEVETFGSSKFNIPGLRRDASDVRNVDPDPMMFKFASSASHLVGKPLTSSETFTWLTEHFKTSLSQMKPEVEQLFLNGVNHVFYHGTTFTPKDVPYPGWLFYASVNFTTNNSFWDHLLGLNQYVTRVQSVLQTTQPDNELLVYWPVYDIWNDANGLMTTLSVHHVDRWLHKSPFYKQSMLLQQRGYSFDFVSDKFIAQSNASDAGIRTAAGKNTYKVIYVPSATYFSEVTMENLLRLANEGAIVIFQTLPEDVPGYADHKNRKAKLKALINQLGFGEDNPHQYTSLGKGKIYLTTDVHSALETEKIHGERLAR
ncbi:MAG TPA: glycosyl hydrolase, partial [Sphingobacterium sp.]|nr:glycosyl hydrolase [Sphingobacterium sp.]